MTTLDVQKQIVSIFEGIDKSDDGKAAAELKITALTNGKSVDYVSNIVNELGKYYKNLGVAISMLNDKVAALNKQLSAIKSLQDLIKSVCLKIMTDYSIDEVKTLEAHCCVCCGPCSCEIIDESKIPIEFTEMVKNIKKQLIKKAIDAGTLVDGARLVPGTPYVKIS